MDLASLGLRRKLAPLLSYPGALISGHYVTLIGAAWAHLGLAPSHPHLLLCLGPVLPFPVLSSPTFRFSSTVLSPRVCVVCGGGQSGLWIARQWDWLGGGLGLRGLLEGVQRGCRRTRRYK